MKKRYYYLAPLLAVMATQPLPLMAWEAGSESLITKTTTVPVVDGNIDAVWYDGYAFPIGIVQEGVVNDATDLSAVWRALYTDEGLYLLVDIQDDFLTSTHGQAVYQQDRIEVYFNMDNVKPGGGNSRTGDNYQYAFNFEMPDEELGSPNAVWAGVEWSQVATDDGWRAEIYFPWQSLGINPPVAGERFGFDIAINDNDGGINYDGVVYWYNAINAMWGNIDGAGTVTLGDSAKSVIPKVTTAPAVNAMLDDIWQVGGANPIGIVQDGSVDDADDNSAVWYGLYTDEKFYVLVDITDDYLTSTDGSEVYYQDRIEVFFNMDNLKPNGGNARTGDNYQYAFNLNMPDEQFGSPNANWSGVEWAHVTTDDGWRVAVSFPWATLGISPPTAGFNFGFDIAVNDNDGGDTTDSVLYWHNASSALWGNIDGAGTVEMGATFDGNYPPSIAGLDAQIAVEGTGSSFNVTASDLNAQDTLSFSAEGLPSFILLTDNGNGTATFNVNAASGNSGTYQFPVFVSDGTASASILVTVLVQTAAGPVSPDIVFVDDVTMAEGGEFYLNVYARDADSLDVVFTATDLPDFATITNRRDKTARITVNPAVGDKGVYSVSLLATDEMGNTDTAFFTIYVLVYWGEYPVDDNQIADTGDFLGYVYAGLEPWVYVYDSDAWIYVPENGLRSDGNWLWFMDADSIGELYTGHSPWLYAYDLAAWVYLAEGDSDTGGNWFWYIR